MAYPMRIPRSGWSACGLLLFGLSLSLWVYDVSDGYVITLLLVTAVTVICMLWCNGCLETSTSQVFAVVAIFTWPFSLLASASEVQFPWNELLFIRISAGFAAVKLLTFLPASFPRSFSSCELCITLQLAIPFLSTSVACLLENYLRLEYSLCGSHKSTKVIHFLSLGLALFVISCQLIAAKSQRRNRSPLVFAAFLSSAALTYFALFRSLEAEPVQWLLRFLTRSERRRNLMLKWAGCLLLNLVFAAVWTRTSTGSAGTKIRKIFHVGISAVFVIGVKEDPELLSFCSACLLLIFLFLECFRICKVWAISSALDECVAAFKDEKDAGILTTTHIYLLVGVALPLWLLPAGNPISLTTYSGVIAVGFGDTAASLVGSCGRIRWSGSKKTVEGTVAALIAQLLASVAIWYYLNSPQILTLPEVLILTLISATVALVEAKVQDIDNLVLPIYHHTLMLFAKVLYPRL